MDEKEYTTLNVVLTPEIKAYIKDTAKKQGRTLSAQMRWILQRVMASDPYYELPEGNGRVLRPQDS